MNALWVIHIDTSGSMKEPFSGQNEFEGLMEQGTYRSKLDAAKDVLLRQIRGIPGGDIAIVGFADYPHLIYKGSVSHVNTFEEYVKALNAKGNTNIASTLLFTINELEDLGKYKLIRILIISDGLSNRGDPLLAAQQCAESLYNIGISTILIDPTPEGENIARAISIGGDVKAVTSEVRLEQAMESAQADYSRDFQKVQQERTLLKDISGIAVFSGLLVTISGIYTAIAERPNIAAPALFAAIATISSGVFTHLIFVKETSSRGFYRTPDARELYYPIFYKYSKRTRFIASLGSAICIVTSFSLVLLALAFNLIKDREAAERAVSHFHEQFNEGKYSEIYKQSAEYFKIPKNEHEIIKFFEDKKLMLGDKRRTSQEVWDYDYDINSKKLRFTYNTEFTKGKAVEKFIWTVSGDKVMLYQYDIALQITKPLNRLSTHHRKRAGKAGER